MSSNVDHATSRESASRNLNDSWEEVLVKDQNQRGADTPPLILSHIGGAITPPNAPSPTPSMIKLLLDAQRETSSSSSSSSSTPPPSSSLPISLATTDSRSLSGGGQSSRTSPKYSYSPPTTTPVPMYEGPYTRDSQVLPADFINNDWVWDWSSRPEIVPPSEWAMKCVHPLAHAAAEHKSQEAGSSASSCSDSYQQQGWLRRTAVLLDHLPLLLITHACTFILGAATILMYMRKYYN